MKIAIIGAGVVGRGMLKMLSQVYGDVFYIDPLQGFDVPYEETENCELSIICVPTPMADNGSCDTRIVEDAASRCRSPFVLIKSTVTPGTTDKLECAHQPNFCFSPEYMGESRYWTPPEFPDPRAPISHRFMILGGYDEVCSRIADIFLPVVGPATRFRFMRAAEAELVKYAENAFFALKVTFANELRRICTAADINYHVVREGWIDDPRVGAMHTAAFVDKPGFDGKCLPKDISALAAYCRALGEPSVLLESVILANNALVK